MGTIKLGYTDTRSDRTIYAVVINVNTGYYYNSTTGVFETFSGTQADYDISMPHVLNNYYSSELSTDALTDGKYLVRIYSQSGGTPATTDKLLTVSYTYYSERDLIEIDNESLYKRSLVQEAQIANMQQGASIVSLHELNNKLDQLLNLVKALHGRR